MRRTALLASLLLLLAVGTTTASAAPIADHARTSHGTSTSSNWGGYAAYGTTFSHVSGTWTQPSANCAGLRPNQSSISAFWAGLDGYFSKTVEQTGTEADCAGNSPSYFAWYEFYPAGVVQFNTATHPVVPGDSFTADVSQTGNTTTVVLSDNGPAHTWTDSATLTSRKLALSSAEWIAEAPTKTLTDFGHVDFSGASATGLGVSGHNIDDFTNDQITLQSRNGLVRATPTSLSGGNAFTVDFVHH